MDKEDSDELQQFEGLINGLLEDDFGCCDDFLSPSFIHGLNERLQSHQDAGKLTTAGIGTNQFFQQNTHIRNDQIFWLENSSDHPVEKIFLEKVDKFMQYLNSTCFTSLKDFECHYASYEQHRFYKRHIDQFKSSNGRKFSLVLYLNEQWTEADGGMLSLYPKDKSPINILPLGGRMVFFRSDEMEHEVHPSLTRERRSIACWLKDTI